MTDEKNPFGWGSIIAAAILGGLVPTVAGPFIVDWIRQGVEEQGLEGFWTPLLSSLALVALMAIAFVLALTFARKAWRDRVWVRLGDWVKGTWPVTTRRLSRQTEAADAAGYARRAGQLATERNQARKPAWFVDQKPHFEAEDVYWLTNRGYTVSDVRIAADPVEMELDEPAYFPGQFGSDQAGGTAGKQFVGHVTTKGKSDGVNFAVTWIDQNGDERADQVFLPPERILENVLETREEAYRRGRSDLQGEIDAVKRKPVRQPRWVVGRKEGGAATEWVVLNTSTGAEARDVTLTAATSYFRFLSGADWGDLTGPASATFRGQPTEGGAHFGVDFIIEWTASDEERYTGSARWEKRTF